ncbi:uncharacterized protein LOC130667101 isoform X3 [Microplitis mediator]|uniref:uncharacterized protein LOC130667101 isoform X3 n=1 Tax=Microplitis mediator TaxID=375433 RepID=UPI002552439F|nr:uncharacterized protein LOC130667101 isoform X3 [Microplitis mediator]
MERTRNYQRIANDTVRNKISSESDFGPRKTIFVLAVVAGCFAILWPKIFYPMLNGPANTVHSPIDGSAPIKQERRIPPHAGGLHPAMRERGRAIPSSHIVPRVEGRPEQVVVQKMRPPMGGPGRVITPHTGGSSMGIIMPLYTVGILLFFLYTISKILRKNSNNEIYPEYTNAEAEREFRDRVFNPKILTTAMTGMPYYRKEKSPESIRRIPTIEELKQQAAGDIEVDQLIQRLADTEAAMERIVVQMGNLSRTVAQNPNSQQDTQGECMDSSCCSIGRNGIEELDRSSPTVKVIGMEMTANCEGGQKISRPSTPTTTHSLNHLEREKTPPKPIYLEGALPSQCELLVTDSKTQTENLEENAGAPVVLSGKMTLSLISLDQIAANSKEINGKFDEYKEKIVKIVPENYKALDKSKQVDLNNDKIAITKSKNMLNKKIKENEYIDKDEDVDEGDNDDNGDSDNDNDDDDKEEDDEDVSHEEDVDNDNDDNNDNDNNDNDDGNVNDDNSKKISSKATMLF